jgi:hypothetical protein
LFAAAADPIIAPTASPPITPAATAALSLAFALVGMANAATARQAAAHKTKVLFITSPCVHSLAHRPAFISQGVLHVTAERQLNIRRGTYNVDKQLQLLPKIGRAYSQ